MLAKKGKEQEKRFLLTILACKSLIPIIARAIPVHLFKILNILFIYNEGDSM